MSSLQTFLNRKRKLEESPEELSVDVSSVEEFNEPDFDNFKNMSKLEIDNYAKENFNIDLDRRKKKTSMLSDFKNFLTDRTQ